MNGGMYSSQSDQWETPQSFFDVLNNRFNFTLDPCCVPSSAKCSIYFTPEDDGLAKSWEGHTVFMNPPYGRVIGQWVKKAREEAEQHGITVVCLLPARTDTRWWQDNIWSEESGQHPSVKEIQFIRGRLKFGNSENSAPMPSVVVVY